MIENSDNETEYIIQIQLAFKSLHDVKLYSKIETDILWINTITMHNRRIKLVIKISVSTAVSWN